MAKLRTHLHAAAEMARLSHLDFFPLRKVVAGYKPADARGDLKAGLNVALLAFPQSMAYAAIAGLPIQWGIYCAAIGTLAAPLLSGSRFLILGPANATAVMLFAAFLSLGIQGEAAATLVPLITLLTGVFLFIGAFLRVSNLIQFVSRSVISGYITAAAFYIIVNQLRKVIGVEFDIAPGSTLLDVLWNTLAEIPHAHLPTIILSALTAVFYWILNKAFPKLPTVAIALVMMSIVAWGMNQAMIHWGIMDQFGPFEHLEPVSASSWKLTLPEFSLDRLGLVAQTALLIAFLSVLSGASLGKSIAARTAERFDMGQEMLGMGVSNLAASFLHGMPSGVSPVRTQLNASSGAKTSLASAMSGLIVVIAIFTIGPFTRYIPTGALGVLIIGIGFSLFNLKELRIVMKSTRSDALVFLTTFVASLLVRLDFAIILGTATSILLFLRKAAVPRLVEYGTTDEGELKPIEQREKRQTVAIIHVEGELFFGAADLFRDQMRRVTEDPNLKVVILKLRNAHHLDATSIMALEELIRHMRENGRVLLVSEARKEAIRIFKNSGLFDVIGRENIFPDNLENPTLPTAKALRRAKSLLSEKDAHVSIYLGTQSRAKGAKSEGEE